MPLVSVVSGTGGSLPKKCVSNAELEKKVETTDAWIVERTGIKSRYIADATETAATLGIQAARQAVQKAGLEPNDIDLLICATSTPDLTLPATAVLIQGALGIKQGCAFDVQAVCSGFVYALSIADNFIRLGQSKCALVIGSEVFSRILDWSDRGTCVLFGDGAGAVVLEAQKTALSSKDGLPSRGILTTHLHSDGALAEILKTSGGTGTTQENGVILMQGREVFRHAVEKMSRVVEEALTAQNKTVDDLDWFVSHQANMRIMIAVAERLNIPLEKVIVTVDAHANTSAASIPLALAHADAQNKFKKGDLIMLEALGAGLTWGSVLLRW